jgi:hypothetical protein
MDAMGYERDGAGFTVEGPDGVKRFEETPNEATPAWRRALELGRDANRRRN